LHRGISILPLQVLSTVAARSEAPFLALQEGWTLLVRVGLHYRALAVEHEDSIVWFWVGPHAPYNRLIGAR